MGWKAKWDGLLALIWASGFVLGLVAGRFIA